MKDSQGNKASVTVEEGCDTAQICGMKDKDGKSLYFESEAYHISTFCNDNDIEGIVFHHKTDGRMCKLRKSDFNVKRVS